MNSFRIKDWVCVNRSQAVNIFQNQLTAQLCEEYVLEVRCEELLEHFQALEAINHPQLSKLLYLEKFTKYDELSYAFSHFSLRLFSEFMEVRLGDIGNIPDHHLYHLLYETLAGFQAVFHNVRPIRASPLNIGFNKKNELKIVLYEDLSREPTNEITEEAVVQSVLDVYKSYIGNRLTIPQAMNFTEALYFVGYRVNIEKNQQPTRKLHRKDPRFSMFETRSRGQRESIDPVRQEFVGYQNFGREQRIPISRMMPNLSTQTSVRNLVSGLNQSARIHLDVGEVRTTQNNLSIVGDMVEMDMSSLSLELLDDKKPQYIKLNLIDRILTDGQGDEAIKRLCRIYKYALISDSQLYAQLKRVRGKFELIENTQLQERIQEVMDNKEKYQGLTNRLPSLNLSKPSSDAPERNERIKNIIQHEKLKMQLGPTVRLTKPSFSPSKNVSRQSLVGEEAIGRQGEKIKRFNEFKEEASKVLFDF